MNVGYRIKFPEFDSSVFLLGDLKPPVTPPLKIDEPENSLPGGGAGVKAYVYRAWHPTHGSHWLGS